MESPGWASLCLRVADLEASKRFYTHLGMQVIEEYAGEGGKRAVLQCGSFNLALMTFLDANLINFRGGDVFAIHEHMKAAFPDLDGEPERYTAEQYGATAPGECWSTRDPDGNEIFFDTNETETGDGYIQSRTIDILRNAATELEALGADPEVLESLRTEVLEKFAGASR